jgi:hypothetical protein
MGLNKNNRGGQAFDAAVSSGLAFLSSQLEYASPELVKPLTSMTHPRDITVEFGGGFVEFISAYASDYGTTGGNQYGLQDNDNTDIAQVQVSVSKGLWSAWNWASSFTITDIDLKRLQAAKRYGQPAPFSIQEMLEDGVQLVWNKALERVVYLGWLGQPGLINNTNVTSALAPATGTGSARTWASKTPVQIQTDINSGLNATLNASAYSLDGMADTMLISWTEYQLLMQPMTTGGFSSVLEFLLANNIARQNGIDFKIFPLANPWIVGQGAGSTDRAVFYRNNKKTVTFRVPQPIVKAFTLPTTRGGGSYETIFNGCIGQPQFLRLQPFYYLDGIG